MKYVLQPKQVVREDASLIHWGCEAETEAQKKGQDSGNKPAPKTGMQKLGDKSLTYWDMMKFVVAFGPPATYMWSLLMIHMWNSLKDAVSTLH